MRPAETMPRSRLVIVLTVSHLTCALALVGVTAYDTLVTYPAWFAHIPDSLEAAYRSNGGSATARWFTWLGGGVIATAIALAIAAWRQALPRNLVLASAGVVLLVGGVTAVYFDPLVTILIRQGARMWTNEVLHGQARQFQQIDWIRFANVAGAALGLSLPAAIRLLRREPED